MRSEDVDDLDKLASFKVSDAARRSTRTLDLAAMRAVTIALVLVASPAIASDFRLANLGDPCSSIRKLEAALGSTEVWSNRSGDSEDIEFHGQVFEREVRVGYNCDDGKILSGSYLFPPEEKDQAAETFKVAYDGLVAMYGAPLDDNTPWQHAGLTNDRRVIPTDPAAYYSRWSTSRASTVVTLVLDKTQTPPKWRVVVAVAPNPT